MSTEDPTAGPALTATPPEHLSRVGDVELGSGMILRLDADDYFWSATLDAAPILLGITRVGQILQSRSHVLVEGYQLLDGFVRARVVAVRIAALESSLIAVAH